MTRTKSILPLLVGRSMLVGIGLGVLYWILASAIGAYVFHEGSFASSAFTPDRHEIWLRVPAICFFAVFGAYAQFTATRRQGREEALRRAHEEREAQVAERTAELGASQERLRQEITEHKRAEEEARRHRAELAHVSRVSTLGEMASALAHELVQPFSAIVNYNEACMRALRSGAVGQDKLLHDMGRISHEAERAGEIIHRIISFVRKGALQRTRTDVNDLVREVIGLEGPEARQKGVTIHLELADELQALQADLIQIEQVILNLTRNAIDAMGDAAAGMRELTIQTSMAGSNAVEVAVRDTGPGLPADVADRVFEPFFTTKSDGLGLGLAISRSIIDAHGGRLWATPNPDRGTTFRLTLPITEAGHA